MSSDIFIISNAINVQVHHTETFYHFETTSNFNVEKTFDSILLKRINIEILHCFNVKI